VRSIIVMGRNLGLEVIAEGVETQAQADFLKAKDCHALQGFLFSKPLPNEDAARIVRKIIRAGLSVSAIPLERPHRNAV
jgi:EAL domain-containing protein (putative c-di-GMP-specific phosphodiesterase class I)